MTLTIVPLLILVAFGQVHAQSGEIQHKNFPTLQAALDDAEQFILHFNETYNLPSVVFGLAVKGKPILRKAWGLADLENYVLAALTTKYRLASISKTFTSAIIGQLVDQGKLKYDDPISLYLPESVFPAKQVKGERVNITVRHLLSHTAGTHVSDIPADLLQVKMAQNVTETLAQFAAEPLHFAPGTNFSYSNYGFQLLGAIIESITGRPCQDVMQEFLNKNGLASSYVGNGSVVLHDVPRYYVALDPVKNPRENIPTVPYDELVLVEGNWPAGGVVSTIDDLLHYGQLLIDAYHDRPRAILSRGTLLEMWTSQTVHIAMPQNAFHIPSNYGLGWMVPDLNPKLQYPHLRWHSGGLVGVTTLLAVYPDEEAVAVALTNKGAIGVLDQMVLNAVENVLPLVLTVDPNVD